MSFRHITVRKKRKHSLAGEQILGRLDKYIRDNDLVPARLLATHWKYQEDAISYKELRDAILAEDVPEELIDDWTHDYSVFVNEKLAPVWRSAMAAGSLGQPVMDSLILDGKFEMDLTTRQVIDWIDRRGASFVTAVASEQTEALRNMIRQYTYEKYTVDELAKVIRPCIGLTRGQSAAVMKLYENVRSTLAEQHPRTPKAKIETQSRQKAMRYAEKLHRQRAFMIAQTEMAYSYNHGMHETMRQAMEKGLIGTLEKRWITSGDLNVCPRCESLNGVQIGFYESFDFGKHKTLFDGMEQVPPLHPRCGCAVEYIEVDNPKLDSEGLQGQETEETAQDVFDLEAKESKLQELKEQSQALGEEMNQRMMEAIGRNDIAAIQQISMESGHELSRIGDEISTLEREISDYKARLGGHLTEDDFWSGLPSEYLNRWSYETDMSMQDEIKHALLDWSGEGYKEAKYSPILEEVIDMSSKKFNGGTLYRGMSLPDDLVDSLQVGKEIMQDGLSSWSTSRDIAMQFAYEDKKPVLLVDVTNGERDALSIKAFSHMKYEDEVLYSGKAKLQILNLHSDTIEYSFQGKTRSKEVTIIEVQEVR